MTGRAAIETLITDAYGARHRGDLDALMAYFHPDASYRLAGAPPPEGLFTRPVGHDAIRAQMQGLIDAFVFSNVEVLSLTVEDERATMHWRAEALCVPTGRKEPFDIVDVFTFADGKILSLTQFTDTAGVARLTAA